MARYFFHIKDGNDLIRDEEGTELPGLEEARAKAILAAREILAQAIKTAEPEFRLNAIVVHDEDGGQVIFVPFIEVLPQNFRRGGA